MITTFKQANSRFLKETEFSIRSENGRCPLIIEPADIQNGMLLSDFLAENKDNVNAATHEYGAVLLRGFTTPSENEFEKGMMILRPNQLMDRYFLSEKGRTLVEGTRNVFYTNKFIKTGGTFDFGGFHSENYYTVDVPGFITFFCLKPSAFGGETGLIDMEMVYRDLPDLMKKKLESKTFLTGTKSISAVAERYAISEEKVKAYCNKFGIEFERGKDGNEHILIFKPVVCIHPKSSKPVLICNLSREIPQLDTELRKLFKADYSTIKWLLHRFIWRYPAIITSLRFNNVFAKFMGCLKQDNDLKVKLSNDSNENRKISEVFSYDDIKILSKVMRKHFLSFTWKKGDVLLVDNMRMAHAGMPGLGPRTIRTIISDPYSMIFSQHDKGIQLPRRSDINAIVATRIETGNSL
ncbi:alpha-ketoglutarate-dependent taurine dioxygenase [Mucilaginibacter sp. SG538B]|uniref:TauD/TfdA family dioxygenase n=1 Tax=Mucilaginibacter sp. SG538B TaxID=2587021 RepID=UPI00159D87D2|nr:TauD/TfdA family dioxygenase [Mucilaginibacter sp. SG538B]NVM66963.1 alpha-ketoglutarate-dependent taurine dioxygenase [Mucilaginibacter sp. SG538B]